MFFPGDPIALKRPGANHVKRIMYNSQQTQMMVDSIRLRDQHFKQPLFDGPLHMDVTFFMRPSKKFTALNKKTFINQYHTFIPDLSNMIKYVEDTAQGILYKNDSIISSITAKKVYDLNPRTEFTLKTLI